MLPLHSQGSKSYRNDSVIWLSLASIGAFMFAIAHPLLGAEEEAAALRVLESGRLAQGEAQQN
jgi:hypothetical protein